MGVSCAHSQGVAGGSSVEVSAHVNPLAQVSHTLVVDPSSRPPAV